MKTKISKILGVGLTIIMLTSLLVVSAPVSAATLSWGNEGSVTDLIDGIDLVIGPAGVDLVDMAVNGDVIYGVAGTSLAGNVTYKSTDGGMTWNSLVTSTDYPGDLPLLIAVAPDDSDVVVLVTDNGSIDEMFEVYLSTDGGSSWDALDIPDGVDTVNDIDLSMGPVNYVAFVGATSSGAELWTLKLAMAENWAAESGEGTSSGSGNLTSTDEALAVMFSPNFETDETILVVSGDNGSSTADPFLHMFRWTEGQQAWNSEIAYEEMDDWADGLTIDAGTIAGGNAAADIVVPDSYLATDVYERIVIVATAGGTGGGGIVRFSDTDPERFEDWAGTDIGVGIGSIAFHESGMVIAGEYLDNRVFAFSGYTGAPEAMRTNTLKGPSGVNRTLVAWSGDNAVATTSGTESAFAVSTDNGYAWNDVSLIDTTISAVSDIAVGMDGSPVYMATHDGASSYDVSIWNNSGGWKRILNNPGATAFTATTAPFLIRIAPDDSSIVYISSQTTDDLWRSTTSGESTWKHVPAYKLDDIQDFFVESADVVYAIDSNGASKTTSGGASWGDKKGLDNVTGFMVTVANGDVLVGGEDGDVAFSKDGGATFTRITDTTDSDPVHIVADVDYATNNQVFIAAGDEVEHGAIAKGTSWDSKEADGISDNVTGIGQYEGILYVMTSNGTDSRLWQSRGLLTAATVADANWSFRESGRVFAAGTPGAATAVTPQALKMSLSGGSPRFWAINTETSSTQGRVARITIPVALVGPTLTGPADGTVIPLNKESGASYDVTFSWNRYSDTDITTMDLQIATDSAFNAKIVDETVTGIDSDDIAQVIGPGRASPWDASFNPGTTYYWRVRHSKELGPGEDDGDADFEGPWSEARSIVIESVDVPFSVAGPIVGASDVAVMPVLNWAAYEGAIRYQLELSEDPSFAIIEWSHNVDDTFYAVGSGEALGYSTAYYWRVRGITAEPYTSGKSVVVPAGPWVTGVFTTMAEPAGPSEPAVVTITEPAPPAPPPTIVKVPETTVVQQAIPSWMLLTIIIIGAVLVIALIVLIVRTRRVA
ncbi:WD40/YVTN/BNR-like repeat-containing protein [Chloroflexota bacterium]